MRKLPLHWQIIIGLILGVIWALVSSSLGWSKFTLNWINPFGEIFINLLKLIAVPLVLFSIISGVSGLPDATKLGKMGAKTLGAYVLTTLFAVTIGLLLVNIIGPGRMAAEEQRVANNINYQEFVAERDGISLTEGDGGGISEEDVEIDPSLKTKIGDAKKQKDQGPLQFIVDMVPSNIFFSLNNNGLMLQVIFFAIFFGVVLLILPFEKARPMIELVNSANEVFLKMVDVVMQGAPFFVFALLAGKISEMAGDNPANVIQIFKGLGYYSLTVVAGLAIMIFIIYPTIIRIFVNEIGPRSFLKGIGPAQLLAFSSSSSAATLPVTMDCVRENLGVSKEVTSFVLPIGATVNMDGTSLYQAVAVVFLAQFHMVELTLAQQLIIVLTATLASIGSAAVPSAGLIMLIIVLESVGLNPAWIAIVFPVDRILDMCRTVVNVTGDATISTLIAKSESELHYKGEKTLTNFDI